MSLMNVCDEFLITRLQKYMQQYSRVDLYKVMEFTMFILVIAYTVKLAGNAVDPYFAQ